MEKYTELKNLLKFVELSKAAYPYSWLRLLEVTRKAIRIACERGEMDSYEFITLMALSHRIQDRKWLSSQ